MTKKKPDTTLPIDPVADYEEPVAESDSAGPDDDGPRPKDGRSWSNRKMRTVRVDDRVKAEGVRVFTVAGIRLNPADMPHNARIRLFDNESVLRLEAEPNYVVEVER
jgi:hypothetical protein